MAQTRTADQEAARARLLATGKYETYTDATGKTAIRLKKEYQTNNSNNSTGTDSTA